MNGSRRRFLFCQAGLLAFGLLFPLYRWGVAQLPGTFSGCFLHDMLFLYCPLCGGTRTIEALLQWNVGAAWERNAFVTLMCLVGILLDIAAWIRFLRGKTPWFRFPRWSWILIAVSFLGYAVLRNGLMIAYGIDPLGDLGAFWALVRAA